MVKVRWLIILFLFLVVVHPSFADDRERLLGIWRFVSQEWEDQATGKRDMGKNPTGYVIFTPEGRIMSIMTQEGRKAPKTDQDRSDLFLSMSAYSGMYRLEGDKWITKVDVSWSPATLGTEQVRFFRFDGDRLYVMSGWMPHPSRPGGAMGRLLITLERAK